MAKIGRNAPCPCGSGKKYKRCCLLRDQPTPAPYTVQERQSALIKTSVFFEQPRWREVLESLADDFDADLDLDAGLDLINLFLANLARQQLIAQNNQRLM